MTCDVDRTGQCITCGDVATRMRVLHVDDHTGLARCADAEGETEDVDVALVDAVQAGDGVLVHAGVALVKLEPQEAIA